MSCRLLVVALVLLASPLAFAQSPDADGGASDGGHLLSAEGTRDAASDAGIIVPAERCLFLDAGDGCALVDSGGDIDSGALDKAHGTSVEPTQAGPRSRASCAARVFLGAASSWSSPAALSVGVVLQGHLGFWGTPPRGGMASGVELQLETRGSVPYMTGDAALEALVTARYFFGRLGVGAAGEYRLLTTVSAGPWGVAPPWNASSVSVGGALGFAFIDTADLRMLVALSYLPVNTYGTVDPARLVSDLELSLDHLSLHLTGGTWIQRRYMGGSGNPTLWWQLGLSFGGRFAW